MEVLWERETATVAEVAESLQGTEGSAYTTILTLMRILRDKGYLTSRKQGKADIYRPKVTRQTAARRATKQLLGKFFDHSPGELLLSFLRHEDLQPEELDALKQQILDSERGREDEL